MLDLDLTTFENTPGRLLILENLRGAQQQLESAAANLRKNGGSEERVHKVVNIATQAAAQRHLLAQDWSIEDGARGRQA